MLEELTGFGWRVYMAYDARVYRILIASPSDVADEREIAVRVIQEWNDLHSYNRNITLLPLRWETHVAPEYGARPQEVVNRAIVDECDLLVGIFWTRIGSTTGEADSGTLEEIERVGKAGKPIMLYFSRVAVDPENIDTEQIEKLKAFKTATFPTGLVEVYKKIIEFRDKFSKQLQIKIRELQRSDSSGKETLSLQFVETEKGELVQSPPLRHYDFVNVVDLATAPPGARPILEQVIKERNYMPIVTAIENRGSSGIRNLYAELEISSSSPQTEIRDSLSSNPLFDSSMVTLGLRPQYLEVERRMGQILAKFLNSFHRTDKGWRVSWEWDAIQPQRVLLIKPILWIYSPEPSQIGIKAKIFADTFAEPLALDVNWEMGPNQIDKTLRELLPDWERLVSGVP
jgi:hypothetical protein